MMFITVKVDYSFQKIFFDQYSSIVLLQFPSNLLGLLIIFIIQKNSFHWWLGPGLNIIVRYVVVFVDPQQDSLNVNCQPIHKLAHIKVSSPLEISLIGY